MKFSFTNNTGGKYSSDQIYFVIIGKNSTGQFCHVDKDGNLVPCNDSDNDAPGHLTKHQQNWCNYLHTVSEVPEIQVPKIDSGRAYISLGSPVYLKIVNNGYGFVGPNPANSSDPNVDVYFDWLEFTLDDAGFHGNTTQVDQFGFPMTIELTAPDGVSQKRGITESRSALFNDYMTSVPIEFQALAETAYRIIAPFKGDFGSGKKYETYFDSYIAEMWQYYSSNELVFRTHEGTFTSKVENNIFAFTKDGDVNTMYTIDYPTSSQVFECAGVFAKGDATAKVIQSQVSAMLNRHILGNPENRYTPEKYYQNAPANYYAEFWHRHSIDNKAYGFPFDDVCEQSTLIEEQNPEELKVAISWN
ncbi:MULTISPECIES: glycoside hydrolase family 64 protein [unclassified Microcoleus]|uniref:glycoside hydrolase family 64 protein n=1 Tax=unclassified Microcoleus TaxID=2642155 RepID=UPI002FCFDDFE